MVPWRGEGVAAPLTLPACTNPQLSYFGGPLVQSPTIIPVFWSTDVNATLVANIPQFYADVTNSSYWQWLSEYDSVGLSPGTSQAILPGNGHAGVVITPLKCAPGGNPCNLTDVDVQNELVRQIGLGALPAPTLDCTGNATTIYMVHFAPNVHLSLFPGFNSCVDFCAYHNTGVYGPTNVPVVYAAIMDYFTGACAMGCGSEPTPLGISTDVASHELVESVTDPDIGLDTDANYAYPAGWGDNFNNCGEIADICDSGAVGDTITVSGRTWYVQQVWSNQQAKCTSTGPAPAICSGTTVTSCRKCSCGDNGLSCSGAAAVCENNSGNVLYGACEQCTSANNACPNGASCLQSTTPAQDDVCACTLAAPTGVTSLTESQPVPGTARLGWTYGGTDATAFDAVRGDLSSLRSSNGNFSAATTTCLGSGTVGPIDDASVPAPGSGFWYLVRAVNCGGKGTYDSSARDTGIAASGHDCN
ncbi:MAG TPA: hypothetical protein VFV19_09090 [Candidatus Polarisedimenticolaceae bacterium]|nr:hypothetical protein [Candidatus Polarisedimenticolaceae bacterium]